MIRLALFEPDIPQNTGTLMRLCACFGVPMDIIEPCGFLLTDKTLKRAGMDYLKDIDLSRHMNWESFTAEHATKRRVLLTTHTTQSFTDFKFNENDILITGRESLGVPDHVRDSCDAHVRIPMMEGMRSINLALSASIVLSEALRQCDLYPKNK